MTSDLDGVRGEYRRSVAAFIQGDADVQKALWSQRDDVTLANPLGPPARGFEAVCRVMDQAAAQIRDGEDYSFELISSIETADLAYEVGIERSRARLAGGDPVPISLRVTTIFRREEGGWKIVHRHADAVTAPRPIESVSVPAGDGG